MIAEGYLNTYSRRELDPGQTIFVSLGRAKIEAEKFSGSPSHSSQTFLIGTPRPIFLANLPMLRITSVAGASAPPVPTGKKDIALAATEANPVTVVLNSVGVPLGAVVKVSVTPVSGSTASVDSSPISGTIASGPATASVTIPTGDSTITAFVTYTMIGSLDPELSRFAEGEKIDQIRVEASLGRATGTTLITETGREIQVPLAALAGWAER